MVAENKLGMNGERARFRLEVLSPLHVGDGSTLTRMEYFMDGKKLRVVHLDNLLELLRIKEKLEDFTNAIKEKRRDFDLTDYISGRLSLTQEEKDKVTRYLLPAPYRIGLREFRPFYRDGRGFMCIPGSSIKGAMRMACFYDFMKVMKTGSEKIFESFEKELDNKIENLKGRVRKVRDFSRKLVISYENGYAVTFRYGGKQMINKPNTDIFRCLRVTDAYPVGKKEIEVMVLNAVVKDKDVKGRLQDKAPFFLEMVVIGTFEFEASWDRALAERFRKENAKKINRGELLYLDGLDDILTRCSCFTNDQMKYEIAFFDGCLNGGAVSKSIKEIDKRANFRLGWGTGMAGKTLLMLLDEDIKEKLKKEYNRKDARVRDFPKSRKVVMGTNGKMYLPGFCKLERVT